MNVDLKVVFYNILIKIGWPLENDKKTPCFVIIDHFVYKNSTKNSTKIDSGR